MSKNWRGGEWPPRCHGCGKLVKHDAYQHFVPDNEYGPEELWWECDECRG